TEVELTRLVADAPEWTPRPDVEASEEPEPDGGGDDGDAHLTDLGNAARLVTAHGDDLRFCPSWSAWLVWDGDRWERDESLAIMRRAKRTVRGLYDDALRVDNFEGREKLLKHALRSEQAARLQGMVTLAQSEPGIPVIPDQLDADPWALNVLNGTLDLRTGELRPHRREDLITKLAPVVYAHEARCPLFLAFLDRIFAGNTDLIGFVQRAVGYSLTGDVRERVLLILWGGG